MQSNVTHKSSDFKKNRTAWGLAYSLQDDHFQYCFRISQNAKLWKDHGTFCKTGLQHISLPNMSLQGTPKGPYKTFTLCSQTSGDPQGPPQESLKTFPTTPQGSSKGLPRTTPGTLQNAHRVQSNERGTQGLPQRFPRGIPQGCPQGFLQGFPRDS